METKEVKSTISNLEKAIDDTTILKLLNILNDEVKPTEKLLRETKVGVVVNKYRSNENNEISSLVKKMIKNWREAVQAEKNKSKKASSTSSTGSTPVSSTTNSNANTPISSSSIPPNSSTTKFNGPRNPKNDGVNINHYDNDTRNASISALYTSLAVDRDDSPNHILTIAMEIESEVFKGEYSKVNDSYRNKLRSFTMNLKNKKNPELRERILTRQIIASKFIKMSPNEMAPESLKKEIEKLHKQNLFDAQGATEKRAVTDRFTCGKCKHKKVSYYQMQTRSADEPLTTFCTCENCGNRWKFS
ncbi:tfs1 [Candida pseudojiufengensis]|uniref:tfs1 n=1 Tax=Candida pseudojiufengensis TaxID=497109 RepID=UPI0022249C67|nr:tfs1 [Candida pseudojiufengensis]KAI5960320.1 tfs1 [Candida pseudojiufengensis]